MPTLLVVDDEPNVLYSLEQALASETVRVLTARTARLGIEAVGRDRPDAVILDVRLPDLSGLEALGRMRALEPRMPVIVITAYGATDTAIEAMKQGALDYLLKPVDFDRLNEVVARALALGRRRTDPAAPADADAETVGELLVGRCEPMQEVYKAVGRVARQHVTVLILGESGTGKELVARAIHHHSDRSGGPFLAINCAAIPEHLLESELFGHERGEGAASPHPPTRVGRFEQASGGTVFLDEIADLTPATQAKLLRLLQDEQFERTGGNETVRADVRVIAATTQDLEEMVQDDRFRRDLFYRLKVFTIPLPPLRQRRADLPLLADHFLRQAGREMGKDVRAVSPEALATLSGYGWPGNVRELQSAIRHAVVHAVGDVITLECLPEEVRVGTAGPPATVRQLEVGRLVIDLLEAGEPDAYRKLCQAIDQVVLETVMRRAGGNQVLASEMLGISRTTLRSKLRALGLTVEKQLQAYPEPEG